ncbi:NAD(P)-binding protein [Durotheca rogersii]|uniref:NAD(P)-binding protein n=1 Tax=Durotheca rogersii TaxID=419775 RepID=UPI00221E821B|nr:NAD(P)-binding protein [Durotheca rogersii]KAI5868258.1 NAD(P)-binding protein [Durotheca rogersii]
MPPPRGSYNPIEGPGDYDTTTVVHDDSYPAIDPLKANFHGKAVLVTGASRGLGRAMSVSFAKAGASMIAIAARGDLSTTAEVVKAEAAKAGRPEPKVLPLQFDVSDIKGAEQAAAKVKEVFGRMDIVINNAGVLGQGLVADTDPEEWWKIWRINLFGPYLVARAFIPLLLEGGEKTIVNVSSVGAHCIVPGMSAYQTAKLAVLRLSEFISAEYGDKGLLTYNIHPGNIKTDLVGGAALDAEFLKVFTETAQLSGDSLVYLTSEKRDWLAGRYINVTWDLPELVAMKEDIVEKDKLKVRIVL